ncbi:hypothetical protein HJG53_08160 [Sphingomonas sp. ID1715]|uniref:hypothetical protein n=1 Tax=Sphingomonas sp. ID1715 TaxID=1656898 RepID=UPI0014881D36|nr:hypothetical protein [Sphingomonas sp. ID1715]NNM76870.1 hypothetical protein [Sphingomonas sp. ID1715]
MLNIASIVIGLGALLWALVAFIPLIGALNWLVLPWAILGLALGVLSSRTSGRNLNLLVIAVASVRLMLGGGIL